MNLPNQPPDQPQSWRPGQPTGPQQGPPMTPPPGQPGQPIGPPPGRPGQPMGLPTNPPPGQPAQGLPFQLPSQISPDLLKKLPIKMSLVARIAAIPFFFFALALGSELGSTEYTIYYDGSTSVDQNYEMLPLVILLFAVGIGLLALGQFFKKKELDARQGNFGDGRPAAGPVGNPFAGPPAPAGPVTPSQPGPPAGPTTPGQPGQPAGPSQVNPAESWGSAPPQPPESWGGPPQAGQDPWGTPPRHPYRNPRGGNADGPNR